MTRLSCAIVIASLIAAAPAFAQSPPANADKSDAKALMQSGVKLLEVKDYLGALAIFKDAYARFPSAKILLNIGTTLLLLDRKAEAANAYQRYLDSSDADPNKRAQVQNELAELDKSVGIVEVWARPVDAEVTFGGGEWLPAAHAKVWRTAPGSFTVEARKPGFQNASKSATLAAGEKTTVTLALEEIRKNTTELERPEYPAIVETEQPRSRIGALAMLHVSVVPKLGSAALVGATADVTPLLAVDAAVLLGPGLVSDGMATRPPPSFGGYVGAAFAFLPGALRPRAGAGMTVFSSDGMRFQLRGAGGVEYVANRNISVTVELGAEFVLNPEDDIRELALVPALAVAGRL
jgi:hypothetical protein